MHKILALALVTASLSAFPAALPSFAADTGVCGPDGPEAYKRPGGYCEQLANKGSLIERDCDYYVPPVKKLAAIGLEAKILVADNCYKLPLEEM